MANPDKDTAQKSSNWLILLPWVLLVSILAAGAWYISNLQSASKVPALAQEEQTPNVTQKPAWQPPVSDTETKNTDTSQDAKPVVKSYHNAVAKAAQSVVNIYTTQKVKHPYLDDPMVRQFLQFHGGIPKQDSTNLGSGVIVSADGYIVTNAHVIEQADEITVSLNDGRNSLAKLVGKDPESDLAVIKVDMQDLTPLTFRNEATKVGDVALAIGNPFGVGQTVTQGIISATGRTGLGVNTFEDFIQTDAAINPGNSGGALVDADGNLIGINTMIYSRSGGSMGIGFAIPTVIVEQVMNALISYGRVKRGWLGIEVTSQLKDPTKLDTSTGVEILNVIKGSPAAVSGLQVGDIIVSIDGVAMKDANSLVQYVARKLPNDTLQASILRMGEQVSININLAERPSQKALKAQSNPQLNPQLNQQMNNNGIQGNQNNSNQGYPDNYGANISPNDGNTGLSDEQMQHLQQRLMELLQTN